MVKPKKNFTKYAHVTGDFAYISRLFTRNIQHDAKESRSCRKKYHATLADKLSDIDQLAEAKKSLRAPNLQVRSKQRIK